MMREVLIKWLSGAILGGGDDGGGGGGGGGLRDSIC